MQLLADLVLPHLLILSPRKSRKCWSSRRLRGLALNRIQSRLSRSHFVAKSSLKEENALSIIDEEENE